MTDDHTVRPATLDADLELDPSTWPASDVYRLLTSVVLPRPIAWVSTLATDGTRNLAPYSFFTILAEEPPHLGIVSIGRKDTLSNIEATGEFVVAIATAAQLEQLNDTAIDLPSGHDEFAWAGVEPAPAARVAPARVAQAPVNLECRLAAVHEHGDGSLIVGEVVHAHVRHEFWRDGQVDVALLDPVARLSGREYTMLGERRDLPRPTWSEVR